MGAGARGWLVEVRERHSSNTARGWFAGVRHFCRWLQGEGEADQDATAGIRTPAPGDPETAVLSDEALRALLATCAGTDFTSRRYAFRHTWAHAFRAAGGNEGDLMLPGGWRSRAMLDRYGKTAAADRAADAYRRLSLGDRI